MQTIPLVCQINWDPGLCLNRGGIAVITVYQARVSWIFDIDDLDSGFPAGDIGKVSDDLDS